MPKRKRFFSIDIFTNSQNKQRIRAGQKSKSVSQFSGSDNQYLAMVMLSSWQCLLRYESSTPTQKELVACLSVKVLCVLTRPGVNCAGVCSPRAKTV